MDVGEGEASYQGTDLDLLPTEKFCGASCWRVSSRGSAAIVAGRVCERWEGREALRKAKCRKVVDVQRRILLERRWFLYRVVCLLLCTHKARYLRQPITSTRTVLTPRIPLWRCSSIDLYPVGFFLSLIRLHLKRIRQSFTVLLLPGRFSHRPFDAKGM